MSVIGDAREQEMKTMREVIIDHLTAIGSEGLCNTGHQCGCDIKDLFCCGNCPDKCVPALRHTVTKEDLEDEYEYLVSDSAENCKTIVEWMFSGVEIHEFQPANGMWLDTAIIEKGTKYRRKKPAPPKKVTKLVDRTPEELANFIGVAFFRNNARKDIFKLLIVNLFANQEQYEISLDRGKTWCPMQKTVEIDA